MSLLYGSVDHGFEFYALDAPVVVVSAVIWSHIFRLLSLDQREVVEFAQCSPNPEEVGSSSGCCCRLLCCCRFRGKRFARFLRTETARLENVARKDLKEPKLRSKKVPALR